MVQRLYIFFNCRRRGCMHRKLLEMPVFLARGPVHCMKTGPTMSKRSDKPPATWAIIGDNKSFLDFAWPSLIQLNFFLDKPIRITLRSLITQNSTAHPFSTIYIPTAYALLLPLSPSILHLSIPYSGSLPLPKSPTTKRSHYWLTLLAARRLTPSPPRHTHMLLFHPSISTLPHATQAPAPKSPTTIKSVAYTANLRWPGKCLNCRENFQVLRNLLQWMDKFWLTEYQWPKLKTDETVYKSKLTIKLLSAWLAQHILRPLLESSTLHKLCECVKPLTSKSLEEAPRDPTC